MDLSPRAKERPHAQNPHGRRRHNGEAKRLPADPEGIYPASFCASQRGFNSPPTSADSQGKTSSSAATQGQPHRRRGNNWEARAGGNPTGADEEGGIKAQHAKCTGTNQRTTGSAPVSRSRTSDKIRRCMTEPPGLREVAQKIEYDKYHRDTKKRVGKAARGWAISC